MFCILSHLLTDVMTPSLLLILLLGACQLLQVQGTHLLIGQVKSILRDQERESERERERERERETLNS